VGADVAATFAAATSQVSAAVVADHRDEYSPELLADEAINQEVDGRVEREQNVSDGVDVAVVVFLQRRTRYHRCLNHVNSPITNITILILASCGGVKLLSAGR